MAFTMEKLPTSVPVDPYFKDGPKIREATLELVRTPMRSAPDAIEVTATSTPESLAEAIKTSQIEEKTGLNNTIDSVKPEAPKAPTNESVPLSPQVAALARKEQAFRKQQQELKRQQDALEVDRKEIADLKALKTRLANKDYSDIEKLVPYDEYASYLVDKSGKASPEQQRMQKLEAELERLKTAQDNDVNSRYQEAVNQRRTAVVQLVEANPEFSSIKELKAQEAVVQHILDTFELDDIELSVEQAAKEVEEALLEQGRQWNSLSKLKGPQAPTDVKSSIPEPKNELKTLTSQVGTPPGATRPNRSFAGMTKKEIFAEAKARVLAQAK